MIRSSPSTSEWSVSFVTASAGCALAAPTEAGASTAAIAPAATGNARTNDTIPFHETPPVTARSVVGVGADSSQVLAADGLGPVTKCTLLGTDGVASRGRIELVECSYTRPDADSDPGRPGGRSMKRWLIVGWLAMAAIACGKTESVVRVQKADGSVVDSVRSPRRCRTRLSSAIRAGRPRPS